MHEKPTFVLEDNETMNWSPRKISSHKKTMAGCLDTKNTLGEADDEERERERMVRLQKKTKRN